MRSFFNYMGGKYRIAKLYGPPQRDLIIEPFAGSAGYSVFWNSKKTILADVNPDILNLWEFLIGASHDDIMDIPIIYNTDELPAGFHPGVKPLLGFNFNITSTRSMRKMTPIVLKKQDKKERNRFWSPEKRARIAKNVAKLKNWEVVRGGYAELDNIDAHWHVDPPYQELRLQKYKHRFDDYEGLARWCLSRRGVVDVCESDKADWLPFSVLRESKSSSPERPGSEYVELICRIRDGEVCIWPDVPGSLF